MAKISGHGGYVVKGGSPNKRVDNFEYEYDIEEIIDETTDSGSNGAAEGTPILYKVNSLTFSVFENDTADYATAIGITEGAVLTLYCKRGAHNKCDVFTGTIVRNVSITNTQTGVRRARFTCEYGTITREQNLPTL